MIPLCVDPAKIDEMWPHVRSLIEMAFWAGRGDDSVDAIYQELKVQKSLLWIVWDDDNKQIACAVTTRLILTDRGKICLITSCGGNQIEQWLKFLSEIEKYAKEEGCKFIRFSGRRGWIFYFKCEGWEEPWITLEKQLIKDN